MDETNSTSADSALSTDLVSADFSDFDEDPFANDVAVPSYAQDHHDAAPQSQTAPVKKTTPKTTVAPTVKAPTVKAPTVKAPTPSYDFDAETDAAGMAPVIADSSGTIIEGNPNLGFAIPQIVRWSGKNNDKTGARNDYDTIVEGSAAEKLASSAVAPLVAQARGFSMLTEKQLPQFCKENGLNRNSKQARRLSVAARVGDVLRMPWFSIDVVSADPDTTDYSAMQFRPSKPEQDDKGRERKYEFLTNSITPIGVHPSIPKEWINDAPTIMIAEGMLKADAAVSAMLLDAGVTVEEMKAASATEDARSKLRELFDRVPVSDRILILGIAGVFNWRNNPEWRSLKYQDKTFWIAFDGDTGTNFDVWKQAKELAEYLEGKHAKVKYLSPQRVMGDDGGIDKAGIDDYLAEAGTWKSLIHQVSVALPPKPAKKNEAKIGSWRVAPAGTSVQECMADLDTSGNKTDKTKWVEKVDIGGRIVSVDAHRHATSEEQRTGVFGNGVEEDSVDTQVEIELSWETGGSDKRSAIVKGSEALLNYSPDQWHRHKAFLPSEVLLHPSWPPVDGMKWLSAIKAHRTEERVERVVWSSAGWVPVPDDLPVFIVGKQVIGGSGLSDQALSGISEALLSSSTKFGFEEDPGDFEDPEYRKQVKSDLEAVMQHFVYSGVWTDLSSAAIVLSAAMRPVLPVRPRSTIFFVGAKGTGKSWSAQAIMSFWSPNGVWWESLPGSATDTMNSTEYAVSRSPLWVVDDLAPSPDRRSMEKESKALEDIIRGQFNGTSKRRMGPDGTTRERSEPKALLIATAENELATGSIRERIISVMVRAGTGKGDHNGSLHESRDVTDGLVKWSSESGIPSRLTSAFAKYVRFRASTNPHGWQGEISEIMKAREDANVEASDWLKHHNAITTNTTRAGVLAGDLVVALMYLAKMAEEVGCSKKMQRELDNFVLEDGGMAGAVVSIVAESHQSKSEASPGRAVAMAVRAILGAGKAHVASADDPQRPPVIGPIGNFINSSLGWEYSGDAVKPKGVKIGWTVERDGKVYVMLDSDTAFAEAQRHHPEMIPYGQTKSAAWGGMWDEGIAVEAVGLWQRKSKNNRPLNTVQFRAGSQRPSAVPIELNVLLNGGVTYDHKADGDDETGEEE